MACNNGRKGGNVPFGKIVDLDVIYTGCGYTCNGIVVEPGMRLREILDLLLANLTCENDDDGVQHRVFFGDGEPPVSVTLQANVGDNYLQSNGVLWTLEDEETGEWSSDPFLSENISSGTIWGDIEGDVSEQTDLLGANNHIDEDGNLSAGGIAVAEWDIDIGVLRQENQFLNLDSSYINDLTPSDDGFVGTESSEKSVLLIKKNIFTDSEGATLAEGDELLISTPFERENGELVGNEPASIRLASGQSAGEGIGIRMETPLSLSYTGGAFSFEDTRTGISSNSRIAGTGLQLTARQGQLNLHRVTSGGDVVSGLTILSSGDTNVPINVVGAGSPHIQYTNGMPDSPGNNVLPTIGYIQSEMIQALQDQIDALEARVEALENA